MTKKSGRSAENDTGLSALMDSKHICCMFSWKVLGFSC